MNMLVEETLQSISSIIANNIPEFILDYLPKSVVTRTLLVGTSAGVLAYLIFRKKYNLPPGPYAAPFLGNKLFREGGDWVKKITELGQKYGPIFTLHMGPLPVVVLNNLETINEALLKKGHQTSDRFSVYTIDNTFYNGQDIIFGSYGTGWKLRRKVASRAIRIFMASGNFNLKVEEAVSKTVEAMLKENGRFDPKPYLFYTTLNIIAGMCFSASYEYNDPKYLELLECFEENTRLQSEGMIFENMISFFARWNIFTTRKCKRLIEVNKIGFDFIEEHVNSHRAAFVPGQNRDFVDSVLQAERDIAAEGEDNMAFFQPLHVVLICFDIFVAGNDTSRMTLLWALMYIIGTPGIQQKLQDEVDKATGKTRYPSTEDRDQLHYADAVLHEVMRVGTAAPLGVPHKTSCDITLGGYDVPKNTTIFTNIWALHNDPNFWPDVDKFKPERFLDEEGKMAPKPDNWLPFSAGRRVCLGEPLAKPLLILIMASLFQQLEFSPEPGSTVDIAHMLQGFLIVPKSFKVVVKKRSEGIKY